MCNPRFVNTLEKRNGCIDWTGRRSFSAEYQLAPTMSSSRSTNTPMVDASTTCGWIGSVDFVTLRYCVVKLVIAWVIGSLILWAMEAPEKAVVANTYEELTKEIGVIASDLKTIALTTDTSDEMAEHIKQAYSKLLTIEFRRQSPIDAKTDSQPAYQSAFTFGILITIACATIIGSYSTVAERGGLRAIWYSSIICLLSFMILRDTFHFLLVMIRK